MRLFKGSSEPHLCVDLMLVDMPEGLPVPGISNLVGSVPTWNQDSKLWLGPICEFADRQLHDDGAIIIIHPLRASTKRISWGI